MMSDAARMTAKRASAARALLGWSRSDLAGYVGVSERIIGKYENGLRASHLNLGLLRTTFEGSEAKAEGVPTFYEYISSLPDGEHMWEYSTELHPVIEEGAKTYFAIDFKRGAKLEERTLSLAKTKLMDVALNCRKVDEARAAKIVQGAKVETAAPVAEEDLGNDEETGYVPPSEDDILSSIPF